ncbi:hypothetical protein FSEG_00526 [Fusobacterium necrophorum D12]|nr:hypothetical protein FSEG_00526 [Fusobacterium necrophorum D12]
MKMENAFNFEKDTSKIFEDYFYFKKIGGKV